MNIGSLFSRHAKYRPDHLAVIFENQRLTYQEFNQGINRLANALLNLGVKKGDSRNTIRLRRVHVSDSIDTTLDVQQFLDIVVGAYKRVQAKILIIHFNKNRFRVKNRETCSFV